MTNFIGCQTYTWQMLGAMWVGNLDTVLDAVAAAGYDGIEVTNVTIGQYVDHATAFHDALTSRRLRFPAFACSSTSGWTDPEAVEQDLALIESWIAFLAAFPGTLLALGGASLTHTVDDRSAFQRAAALYNEAGRRAAAVGVQLVVHPSSHHGSILRTADDYHRLLQALDPAFVGMSPDTGHMLRGGQDVASELRGMLQRVRQLHLKDAHGDGRWAPFGRGVLDLPAVLDVLAEGGFSGWLILEEEADEAREDPARAVAEARRELAAAMTRADVRE